MSTTEPTNSTEETIRKKAAEARRVAYGKDGADILDVCSDALRFSGKSSRELARLTELSIPTLTRLMENNRPYNPQSRTLGRVCTGLGISLTTSPFKKTPRKE
jgi:hypothetical protein